MAEDLLEKGAIRPRDKETYAIAPHQDLPRHHLLPYRYAGRGGTGSAGGLILNFTRSF